MKLIDLIELLFRPLPVQFEPVPWHGPMPERWLHGSWCDHVWGPLDKDGRRVKVPVYRFWYSDRFVEMVSEPRVISGPKGCEPLVGSDGKILGWFKL